MVIEACASCGKSITSRDKDVVMDSNDLAKLQEAIDQVGDVRMSLRAGLKADAMRRLAERLDWALNHLRDLAEGI